MSRVIQSTSIFLLILIVGCSVQSKEEVATTNSLQVKGYIVSPQSFQSELVTTANVMANEQVELKAPMAGQVMAI